MYIPPAIPLSEESKQILNGIKKMFDMNDHMYNGVLHIMEELLKSGVDENTIANSNDDDLTNIDDPDDPLDEEDPFNPYDFI